MHRIALANYILLLLLLHKAIVFLFLLGGIRKIMNKYKTKKIYKSEQSKNKIYSLPHYKY